MKPAQLNAARQASSSARSASTAKSLDAAAAGAFLRQGQAGDGVLELQQALKDHGYPLELTGKFGPETEAAVRAFQKANGAQVDGIVGPETVGLLRSVPKVSAGWIAGQKTAAVAPAALSSAKLFTPVNPNAAAQAAGVSAEEREQYAMYAAMVQRAGGQVCPNGQPTVLGLRQGGGKATRCYEDNFIVLTADGHVQRFGGATHPAQTSSTLAPNVDGSRDGRGDVGMICPGNYRVVPNGPHGGAASFQVQTLDGCCDLPGWRNTSHNGQFTAAERARSEQRGDTLNGVLFHQGGPDTPISIGCQTMSPAEYRRFLDAVGGDQACFTYTLVSI
jgi:peptidoglycan hydrolase-like protein with peptidoglycan-binding domain